MGRLTTRVTASGIHAVYSRRAKIGYVTCESGVCNWELVLVSEQFRGHPRGQAESVDRALEELERMLSAWMLAAGMEWKR